MSEDFMIDLKKEQVYWDNYYMHNPKPFQPSGFAKFITPFLKRNRNLIELGCGNGRDSIFFSKLGLEVIGVDIIANEMDYLNLNYSTNKLKFVTDDFTELSYEGEYDYIYSRFTLHSITDTQEDNLLKWIKKSLSKNGLFFVEARSIKDPKFKEGLRLSNKENFTDNHYRRYMDLNQIIKKIEREGLMVKYQIESTGLAIHKEEDPVIIRLIIQHL